MRHPALCSLAVAGLACGTNGRSQTGPISGCNGVSLTGPAAFAPLSGMAFQTSANLGAGQATAGTYVVVIWGNSGDAGTSDQSMQSTCQALLNQTLSIPIFLAPQTVSFNLPDTLGSGSFQTTIVDLTQPFSDSTSALEDIVGSVDIGSLGSQCLNGSFSANLLPVDASTGFAIDGGAATQLNGSFSLPYCG